MRTLARLLPIFVLAAGAGEGAPPAPGVSAPDAIRATDALPVDSARALRCDGREADGSCSRYGVTVGELIATPERWHGRTVRGVGFVLGPFEGALVEITRLEKWARAVPVAPIPWAEPPPAATRP